MNFYLEGRQNPSPIEIFDDGVMKFLMNFYLEGRQMENVTTLCRFQDRRNKVVFIYNLRYVSF